MTVLKETRDFILLCCDQGILKDEEFLVWYEQYKCSELISTLQFMSALPSR